MFESSSEEEKIENPKTEPENKEENTEDKQEEKSPESKDSPIEKENEVQDVKIESTQQVQVEEQKVNELKSSANLKNCSCFKYPEGLEPLTYDIKCQEFVQVK